MFYDAKIMHAVFNFVMLHVKSDIFICFSIKTIKHSCLDTLNKITNKKKLV